MKHKLLSPAAYAKSRNLNRSTISRQLRAGKLSLNDEGLIDPHQADEARQRNLKTKHGGPPAKTAPRKKPGPARGSMADAQRRRELALARTAEIRLRQLQGKLLDSEDVEATWGTIITGLKSLILSLPDDLAPRVAPVSDVLECRELLMHAVRKILTAASQPPDYDVSKKGETHV